MKTIDLHIHSCYSDGTYTPGEIVSLARGAGLSAIALTDHDTAAGIDEAVKRGKELGIRVIPGIELSCEYTVAPGRKKEIHILGYNIDYHQPELAAALEEVAARREKRNIEMCGNLADAGFPISYEKMLRRFPDTIITRAHFARYLYEQDAVESIDSAFRHILAQGGPYYVERKYLTPEQGISLIRGAGGRSVLAHPMLYRLSVSEIRRLLTELTSLGLEGIEAVYSRNRGTDEAFLRKLAGEFQLFITGGTDFHGTNKPELSIGTGTGNLQIPEMLLENL